MDKHEKIGRAYYKLLLSIDWSDEILLAGLREGLNKFLSNAYLKINGKKKQLQGDYYSEKAYHQVKKGDLANLIYEHMVPKSKYIQKPCEKMAQNGNLSESIIVDLLRKYWRIAIITKYEDKLLPRKTMPTDWDSKNIFIRYNNAGIKLIERNVEMK